MKSIISLAIMLLCLTAPALAQKNVVLPKNLSEMLTTAQMATAKKQIASFREKYKAEKEFANDAYIEFAVDTFSISCCEQIYMNSDAGCSTQGMVEGCYAAANDYDVLLNKYYQKLRNRLDGTAREQLTKAQRAWIAFRDADAELSGMSMPPTGTIYRIYHADNYQQCVKQRVVQLFEYYIAGI